MDNGLRDILGNVAEWAGDEADATAAHHVGLGDYTTAASAFSTHITETKAPGTHDAKTGFRIAIPAPVTGQ